MLQVLRTTLFLGQLGDYGRCCILFIPEAFRLEGSLRVLAASQGILLTILPDLPELSMTRVTIVGRIVLLPFTLHLGVGER